MNTDLPRRKRNRLEGYDYSQNGAYFITVCTRDKAPLLGRVIACSAQNTAYVSLTPLGLATERVLTRLSDVEKYVIMPNHVHMLLLLEEEKHAVPRIMRYWKSMITREIGKSIWQRSYYDHIIRDQREYDLIWEYIETNPLRWALDRYYFEPESLLGSIYDRPGTMRTSSPTRCGENPLAFSQKISSKNYKKQRNPP